MKKLILLTLLTLCGTFSAVYAQPQEWTTTQDGNGHWYQAIPAHLGITWSNAKGYAECNGVHLASITSSAENDFVFSLVTDPQFWILCEPDSCNTIGPWVGGFQPPGSPEPAGNWQWTTGESFAYTNWGPSEPNGFIPGNLGVQDGLQFYGLGSGSITRQWNDFPDDGRQSSSGLRYGSLGFIVESDAQFPPLPEPSGNLQGFPPESQACPQAPALACQGFEPPMDNEPVTVKNNKVLPFKATLLDGSVPVTNVDLVAPPVINVLYSPDIGDAIDVTADALPAGQGTEGNQFEFDGTWWHFNLGTKNYTAKGTYTVSIVSGDATEYVVEPTCTAKFMIE